MSMIEKKCVFFDLGGVLYTLDFEAVLKGLEECSDSSIEEITDVLYSPELYERYESGAITSVHFYQKVKELIRKKFGISIDLDLNLIWNKGKED